MKKTQKVILLSVILSVLFLESMVRAATLDITDVPNGTSASVIVPYIEEEPFEGDRRFRIRGLESRIDPEVGYARLMMEFEFRPTNTPSSMTDRYRQVQLIPRIGTSVLIPGLSYWGTVTSMNGLFSAAVDVIMYDIDLSPDLEWEFKLLEREGQYLPLYRGDSLRLTVTPLNLVDIAVTPVPLPATGLSMIAGLAGLGLLAWRRRRPHTT